MSEIKVRDMRRGNFYIVENYVLDEYGADIGPYGIAIYSALCRFASQDGRSYPSYDRLAQITGMSKRRAIQSIEQLIALDLIEKESGQSNGKTNVYCILDVPRIASRTTTVAPDACTIAPDATVGVHHVQSNKTHKNNIQEQEYKPPHAHAREEPPPKAESQPEPYVKALVAKLHSVGVMTNAYITDKYMDLHEVDNIPFEYILRGITAAADNGKQHHFSYVSACIRNAAKGVTPEQLKKNTEQDETHRAIVTGRRGHAAADVDWKEINQLYSPFGVIDAIPQ